ncbi:hypothetical protein AHAS_Ahas19G0089900 [Arachis hypogaea]
MTLGWKLVVTIGSDEPRSPGYAPQAEEGEEDDEIKDLFKTVFVTLFLCECVQVVKEALGSSRGHVRDYMLYIGALDSILS